jgi:hypothetical protein
MLPFLQTGGESMKSAIVSVSLLAGTATIAVGAMSAMVAVAAPRAAADAPAVPTLAGIIEKEIRWGMSHTELTAVYNKTGGLFDLEYAPQIAQLQPGIQMQTLEAERDSRKGSFERSITKLLGDTPTGYDVTPIHLEYTYKNDESVQHVFKDGKNRYFFYIRDRLWKVYDEIPLKEGGKLGKTYQDAVTKLNSVLGVAGRIRAANSAQNLERTEVDWQDRSSHLRAVDRSSDHICGLVMEDRTTLSNLSSLRASKPTDPFQVDPSITAITKGGISDPNAGHGADAGAGKSKTK